MPGARPCLVCTTQGPHPPLPGGAGGPTPRARARAEHIVQLACTVFGTENALVALLEGERIFIRNATGNFAPGDFPWRYSFCGYTLVPKNPTAMVIEDAREDARCARGPPPPPLARSSLALRGCAVSGTIGGVQAARARWHASRRAPRALSAPPGQNLRPDPEARAAARAASATTRS